MELLKIEAGDVLASLHGRRAVKGLVLEARGNGVGRRGDVQSGENKATDTSLKDLPSSVINLLECAWGAQRTQEWESREVFPLQTCQYR